MTQFTKIDLVFTPVHNRTASLRVHIQPRMPRKKKPAAATAVKHEPVNEVIDDSYQRWRLTLPGVQKLDPALHYLEPNANLNVTYSAEGCHVSGYLKDVRPMLAAAVNKWSGGAGCRDCAGIRMQRFMEHIGLITHVAFCKCGKVVGNTVHAA